VFCSPYQVGAEVKTLQIGKDGPDATLRRPTLAGKQVFVEHADAFSLPPDVLVDVTLGLESPGDDVVLGRPYH